MNYPKNEEWTEYLKKTKYYYNVITFELKLYAVWNLRINSKKKMTLWTTKGTNTNKNVFCNKYSLQTIIYFWAA